MNGNKCYIVVYIKKGGRPSFSVHMNSQNAMKELQAFNIKYWEDPLIREIYEDYYVTVEVLI